MSTSESMQSILANKTGLRKFWDYLKHKFRTILSKNEKKSLDIGPSCQIESASLDEEEGNVFHIFNGFGNQLKPISP